jgi:endonuclease YncB( thermonuclease family)
LPGKVVRIVDGDTLVLLDSTNTQHRIRLQGIDTPERKQPYGTRAKQQLGALVAGKQVVIEYEKRDRYGRIIGKVMHQGQDAGLALIEAGLAWHYKRYQSEQSREDRVAYADAEDDARAARRGLWADAAPVAPWDWRRR